MSVEEWYSATNLASLALMSWFSGAASHRIWRMAAHDIIFDKPRVAVLNRSPQWVVDMVECPWCLGWWLNVAFATTAYFGLDYSFPSAVIMAFVGSTITGVLGRGD